MTRPGSWFWPLWIAAVGFLFHVPHTIALRNLLLLVGLLALAWRFRTAPRPIFPDRLKAARWALLALTLWIVVQALAVSPAPTLALDRFRADWLMHLLAGMLAACIAAQVANAAGHRALVSALAVAVALVGLFQGWYWITAGAWPLGTMPYAERDYQSLVHGLLLALLIGDRVAWLMRRTSPLALPASAGWILAGVVLCVDPLLRTRNGSVITILLLLAGGLLVLSQSRRRTVIVVALLAATSATLLAYVTARSDTRWSRFAESYAIGWTAASDYWRTNDPATRPATPSGLPLEESAYARAAWSRQALALIAEHPLGLGHGHDAFGRGVALKYGHAGMGSSHSGWLDFALGTGLPGLALLLLGGALAIRGGWRQYRERGDGVGLMFAFLVGSYLLRCLLDGHLSGWRLGLFAFSCGVLIAAMKDAGRHP